MTKTVKARKHTNAASLEVTVPAEIVKNNKLNDGDIFKVELKEKDNKMVLEYERIFENQ
ncbi:MAG: hypothetical protein BTN85_1600 [Candidatus Methanohalarchaeum thermophilum]|uniref:AbrB family transcriptional regulator n=1 Tax=Methanohalarchaeum thermophilum TaxID=1903181 RepID=A0A1Q6DXJ8_METT1|nr:MAG: hypothetical protein BTN85_1600 [Candidatus Methanohalarchaeum thermophilum]